MLVGAVAGLIRALVIHTADANQITVRHGWIFENGAPMPPIELENNSRYDATLIYRGKKYICKPWSLTEIRE
jgi:hypothetical protein